MLKYLLNSLSFLTLSSQFWADGFGSLKRVWDPFFSFHLTSTCQKDLTFVLSPFFFSPNPSSQTGYKEGN